jgi:hypothetical protein
MTVTVAVAIHANVFKLIRLELIDLVLEIELERLKVELFALELELVVKFAAFRLEVELEKMEVVLEVFVLEIEVEMLELLLEVGIVIFDDDDDDEVVEEEEGNEVKGLLELFEEVVKVDFVVEVGAEFDVENVLEEVGNDFKGVDDVVEDVDEVDIDFKDVNDDLADEGDELEEIDMCAMLGLEVADCGGVQPPIIDGTAFSPVVINVIFEPQLAAWARSTFALS